MKIQPILSSILALALFSACKSATTIVENDVGIIQGNVALSVNCDALSNDSAATVQIEGTGFSATTAANGQWQINNVPAGIYNIIITKPDFDTDLIAQDQFSGAGTQFLENQQIHMETLLPDSVLITSVQISKLDSTAYRFNDTARDTSDEYVLDTVGYKYPITFTFTMQGTDSAIYFNEQLTDISRSASLYEGFGFNNGGAAIARNGSIISSGTVISDLDGKGGFYPGYPHPGDTIVVTTTPSPSCQGRKVIVLSKSFVLP